jgi:hypothetical protein
MITLDVRPAQILIPYIDTQGAAGRGNRQGRYMPRLSAISGGYHHLSAIIRHNK